MSVTINGVTYEGSNISVFNNVVKVDGKVVSATPGKNGILGIRVTGTLHNLETGGSVQCDAVAGDVEAGGSVQCDDVGGNVSAGGSVQCDNVEGKIVAGGSVRHG